MGVPKRAAGMQAGEIRMRESHDGWRCEMEMGWCVPAVGCRSMVRSEAPVVGVMVSGVVLCAGLMVGKAG